MVRETAGSRRRLTRVDAARGGEGRAHHGEALQQVVVLRVHLVLGVREPLQLRREEGADLLHADAVEG